MHSIQHALREIAGPATLTSDQLESLAMQFVCSAMPSETLILVSDLMQRSKTIVRILLSVVSRCPEGQRDAAHVMAELSPREVEVCQLVARGDIELHSNILVQ